MDALDINLTSVNSGLFDYINNIIGRSPLILISVLTMVILFVYLVPHLGNVANEQEFQFFDQSNDIFEIILWCIFAFLVLVNSAYFLFGLDVDTAVRNMFSGDKLNVDLKVKERSETGSNNLRSLQSLLGDLYVLKLNEGQDDEGSFVEKAKPKKQASVKTKNKTNEEEDRDTVKINATITPKKIVESNSGKEVFHVPGNKYSYKDSQALCKAYGSRLATYEEVENSYNKGGEWCSYGWSDNQLALFPTQKETYKKLQKMEGHENDCGRPGINGGYIDNDKIKYGVNCFGYKPKMKENDKPLMEKEYLYPKTEKEYKFERDVDKWRNKIPEILVAPFNNKSWSRV